jgi:hypothetical protein
MVAKKPPLAATTTTRPLEELAVLYQRRLVIDNLIRCLEQYDRFCLKTEAAPEQKTA